MGLRNRSYLKDENCFFVTTKCHKWYHLLKDEECKHIVSESINFLNLKYVSSTLAYVIMPNHIHLIQYFDNNPFISSWMRDFKKFTSSRIRQHFDTTNQIGLLETLRFDRRKQIFKIWEDRFDDFAISRLETLSLKLDYIHYNPLQEHWHLTTTPEEWRHSSANYYWCGQQPDVTVTHYQEYF